MKKKLIEKIKRHIKYYIRNTYSKFYWWNVKRTCKHQLTTEVFRCYQDRYVKEKCNICNKELYSDL